MSFIRYVQARRVGDNPAGDFVSDARRDRSLPDAKTWRELKNYLIRKGAGQDVLSAAYAVWRGYENKQRGRP